mgnify:CR=1 FL=1
MFESFLLLSSTGDTLLEKHYRESLRSVVDKFISLKDTSGLVTMVDEYACAKVEMNDVIFLAILKEETQVTVVIEMIYLLIEVIKGSLGKVEAEKIRENFSGVLLALEELIELGGPFTSQVHILSHFLRKPSFFQKFKSKSDNYLEESTSNEQMCEAPWRPRNLRYTLNEILVDVIEYANCTMDKHWNLVRSDLVGHIQANASLSGMPELTMYLHTPRNFLSYSFHSSVIPRKKRFQEERAIVFTPLDSKFVVFKYWMHELTPSLPFKITPEITYEEEAMKLQIKAESKMVLTERPKVEEFKVSFLLPKVCSTPSVAVNLGSFEMEGNKAVWNIGNLNTEKPSMLNGRVPFPKEFASVIKETQMSLEVNFLVIGHSASETRVEKVLAKGESYSPYKGARCVFHSGKFEVRMN